MTDRADVVVIGGGIVGLAAARALLAARPGIAITLLEKEPVLAAHQTGRNSGVLHSGLYYRPGSLKARLCVEGRRRMLAFCEEEDLAVRVCGKLVIARSSREIPGLDNLHQRGTANGIIVERLGPEGISEHEPHAVGVAALWVPSTGVLDFEAVARRIGERLAEQGARVVTDCEVDRIEARSGGVVVGVGEAEVAAHVLVNAAGLHADRIAVMSGVDPPVRIIPFRGEYYVLSKEAAGLVGGLIYPVPDPRFPFLGVHFTRRIDGSVEVGPNAVLALGREHYRGTQADWSGLAEVLGYRGFRRLAVRHAAGGLGEMIRSRSTALYAREARGLVPALRSGDLQRGGSGIRAQAVLADGRLADDFVIAGEGPLIHVLSAPSPAATAALAIGEHLAGLTLERLG